MKLTTAIRARYGGYVRIMQALAHPTRLFIVEELARRECNVTALTRMVGIEMPTMSRHLGLLKNAGLILADKRGAQVFYRMRSRCVLKIFDCVNAIRARDNQN